MDSLNAFTGVVRRCVDDYGMISPGDRIAVGISGGKDSLVLLAALAYLRRYYPATFELEGITIDTGFPGMDFSGVEKMCEELGVPYTRVPTDIREIVFDARQEENPWLALLENAPRRAEHHDEGARLQQACARPPL